MFVPVVTVNGAPGAASAVTQRTGSIAIEIAGGCYVPNPALTLAGSELRCAL